MAIPFDLIRDAALAQAERLLREWFPAGQFHGHEYCIGDITGQPGESLKISVTSGKWKDFADGLSGYDLIDLFAAMHKTDRVTAARDLGVALGITNGYNHSASEGKQPPAPPPALRIPFREAGGWQPILPPPADAPPPPLDGFDVVYTYKDATGRPTHYVGRIEARDGRRKQFVPYTYGVLDGVRGWHKKAPNAPRPLYNLDQLAARPDDTVIVCEGEKATDAGTELFPDYVVVGWSGGAEAIDKTDLAPLDGRRLIFFGDNDEPGRRAVEALRRRFKDCAVVDVSELPPAGDAADLVTDQPEWWLRDRLTYYGERPLELLPARLPDPTTIPPREWLLGTWAIKGFVTVLVAAGGVGKTSLALAAAMGIACYRELLELTIYERVNAAAFILEDPVNELNRRVAALMIKYEVSTADLDGRLFLFSGEDRRLIIAAPGPDRTTVYYPDEQAMIREIRRRKIGFLVIDPYAESHALDENSNPHMVAAAAAWRRVARATNCAIWLIHHVRKGAADGIEASRGAKGLTDSARVGLVMSTMDEKQADFIGIPRCDMLDYVRVDDAKANLAKRNARPKWFRLESVPLHNKTERYKWGDSVQAITPWKPPSRYAGLTADSMIQILTAMHEAEASNPYQPDRRGAHWAGKVIIDICAEAGATITEAEAAQIIADWTADGLIALWTFSDAKQRKKRRGLKVDAKQLAELQRQWPQASRPVRPADEQEQEQPPEAAPPPPDAEPDP